MNDTSGDFSEYRLMILDRLGRIEQSIVGLSTKLDEKHNGVEARVTILEREWENAKGRMAAWSVVFGLIAGAGVSIVTKVFFK